MMPSLYVGVAAQTALAQRMETLASNVANSSTIGYRADGLKFDYAISEGRPDLRYFPSAAKEFITTDPGAAIRTGNPLDVAVRGDGWISLQSPGGQIYTRDGRLLLSSSGELQSVNGYPVLDASGSPIVLDPAGGEPSISADGNISQRNVPVGAIGLFAIDPSARVTRFDNSGVRPDIAATPILEFARNGLLQGYLEQSNSNPVREMTRLIEIQRSFENISAAMDMADATQLEAIKVLGAAS